MSKDYFHSLIGFSSELINVLSIKKGQEKWSVTSSHGLFHPPDSPKPKYVQFPVVYDEDKGANIHIFKNRNQQMFYFSDRLSK